MASARKIKNVALEQMRRRFEAKKAQQELKKADDEKLSKDIEKLKNPIKKPEPVNPVEKKVRSATRKDVNTALAWFYSEIKGELGPDGRAKSRTRRIPDSAFNPARDPFIGGMFFYIYDAKHKDTLPYWDKFPLVIPISMYDDGFLGLNLHYLPPMGRAKLMDVLLKQKRRALTPRAYMKLSYEFLKGTVDSKLFSPCIHRYLTGHIRSNLVKVKDEYWDRAAILPVQKFTGASDKEVWAKSMRRTTRKKKT